MVSKSRLLLSPPSSAVSITGNKLHEKMFSGLWAARRWQGNIRTTWNLARWSFWRRWKVIFQRRLLQREKRLRVPWETKLVEIWFTAFSLLFFFPVWIIDNWGYSGRLFPDDGKVELENDRRFGVWSASLQVWDLTPCCTGWGEPEVESFVLPVSFMASPDICQCCGYRRGHELKPKGLLLAPEIDWGSLEVRGKAQKPPKVVWVCDQDAQGHPTGKRHCGKTKMYRRV